MSSYISSDQDDPIIAYTIDQKIYVQVQATGRVTCLSGDFYETDNFCFSNDYRLFAFTSYGTAYVYNLVLDAIILKYIDDLCIYRLRFSPYNLLLVVEGILYTRSYTNDGDVNEDGFTEIIVFDMIDGTKIVDSREGIWKNDFNLDWVGQPIFLSNGRILQIIHNRDELILWSLLENKLIKTLCLFSNTIISADFSFEGGVLVASVSKKHYCETEWGSIEEIDREEIRIVDLATGEVEELKIKCSSFRISSHGQLVALLCANEVIVWDVKRKIILQTITNIESRFSLGKFKDNDKSIMLIDTGSQSDFDFKIYDIGTTKQSFQKNTTDLIDENKSVVRTSVINRLPVKSSNIATIGYNETSKLLEVEFSNGAVYQYTDVPANIYQELMSASSHGRYFDAHVKKAGYYTIRIL